MAFPVPRHVAVTATVFGTLIDGARATGLGHDSAAHASATSGSLVVVYIVLAAAAAILVVTMIRQTVSRRTPPTEVTIAINGPGPAITTATVRRDSDIKNVFEHHARRFSSGPGRYGQLVFYKNGVRIDAFELRMCQHDAANTVNVACRYDSTVPRDNASTVIIQPKVPWPANERIPEGADLGLLARLGWSFTHSQRRYSWGQNRPHGTAKKSHTTYDNSCGSGSGLPDPTLPAEPKIWYPRDESISTLLHTSSTTRLREVLAVLSAPHQWYTLTICRLRLHLRHLRRHHSRRWAPGNLRQPLNQRLKHYMLHLGASSQFPTSSRVTKTCRYARTHQSGVYPVGYLRKMPARLSSKALTMAICTRSTSQ